MTSIRLTSLFFCVLIAASAQAAISRDDLKKALDANPDLVLSALQKVDKMRFFEFIVESQQEYQKNLESFLGLALKAQAQSRATIQAVVELKYPRQVSFVKQANISHGPQQVNNAPGIESSTRTIAHTEENQTQQSKLLEDDTHGGTYLDTRATTAAGRSNPALEAVGAIHRTKKSRG